MKKLYFTTVITLIISIFSQINAQQSRPSSKQLSVNLVLQSQTNWCWAATSKAIIDYYDKTAYENQIAETARAYNTSYFGNVSCYTNPSGDCNKPNALFSGEAGFPSSVQMLLRVWEIKSEAVGNAISFDEIVTSIDARKPIIARIGWKSGGGHIFALIGYSKNKIKNSNETTENVTYMDPGDGIGVADFSYLTNNTSYLWTHSLKMTDEPVKTADKKLGTSSVEEEKNTEIKLYPNPVIDYVNLSGDSKIVQANIFSTTGAKVNANLSVEGKINVSQLSSGVYILNAKLENGQEIRKTFIKK